MKRSNGLVIALVLLGGAAIFITRLLLENFQLQAELASLRSHQVAAAKAPPPAAPAAAAPSAPAVNSSGRNVIESARQMMVDALAAEEGDEKKLWIRVDPRDREASGFASQIAKVFQDSGWDVKILDHEGMRFKAGLLLLVASEEEPPSYVVSAQRAIEAIGQSVTTGRGYQSYYEAKKKEDPAWEGTKFLPDQTYVLLVGRQPPPEAAAAE
ncbi:MAG: hypothetical protein ABR538_14940 [Candidatus Binatia bacterium]